MNKIEHLTVIVGEEAAEVVQAASKCLRFGPDEVYKLIGKSNIKRVLIEFNELFAVLEMLKDEGAFTESIFDPEIIANKKLKVLDYMEESRLCGTLDKEQK